MKTKITREKDERYLVQSDSGATYHVIFSDTNDTYPVYHLIRTPIDGGGYFWFCDCERGKASRPCENISDLLNMRFAKKEE